MQTIPLFRTAALARLKRRQERRLPSSPAAEKLNLIDHFFGRSDGDELEQSTHLFTNRLRLLLREDHPSVGLALCKKVAVQAKEVPDVEAVQHTAVRSGPIQLLQIGRAEHLGLTCSGHIQTAVPERVYQAVAVRVLIQIQGDSHFVCRER